MGNVDRAGDSHNHKKTSHDFISVVQSMLDYATRGLSLNDFLKKVAALLIEFTECDFLEIRMVRRNRLFRCTAQTSHEEYIEVDVLPFTDEAEGVVVPQLKDDSDFELLCRDIACGKIDVSLPYFTKKGSFCIGNTGAPLELSSETCKWAGGRTIHIGGEYKSLFLMRFGIEEKNFGLLILKSAKRDHLSGSDIKYIEGLGHILGIAIIHRRTQVALRERVKELTCLYGIDKVAYRPGISLDDILWEIVRLLPPAWLYSRIATARIVLDGRTYALPEFDDNLQKLFSDIVSGGKKRGAIEVAYTQELPPLDEGPFLREERSLIDAIAVEIGLILERRRAEEEKEILQEQLRHADRLATIGQFSAGIAHELNEPLGNILGFAQLVKNSPDLPEQIEKDIKKIEAASIHAREVVKKLMLFARQSPQQKEIADINRIVEEGLYFFEARCAKSGIALKKELTRNLPEILADENQLQQVLVNLVVNAIQAIPGKGTITITTGEYVNGVFLAVQDNGVGMPDDVRDKIFLPFFTTKDVSEGTGLGLAVVHGIVASHGGEIIVSSKLGEGSRFEVRIPFKGGNA
jgi:two-component system NtrC family sensor kinase